MSAKQTAFSRGKRLRELRKARNLSVRDVEKQSLGFAKRMAIPELYLRRAWLSRLEIAKGTPNAANFLTLSELYGITLRELVENYYRW